MTTETVVIPAQFRGPPSSGNGGYVSGVFGRLWANGRALGADDAPEVTLRAPIPLDRPLDVVREADRLTIREGETLIAEVVRGTLDFPVPPPASWAEALAARPTSPCLTMGMHQLFPGGTERLGAHPICFCCGAELSATEGLRVHAAPIPGRSQVAAAWACDPVFAIGGQVPDEILSTALDCPGQFAWAAEGTRTGMLGRISARVERPIAPGEQCVVIGWTMGVDGRKYHAGTAVFDAAGRLAARAKAVWIGRPAA